MRIIDHLRKFMLSEKTIQLLKDMRFWEVDFQFITQGSILFCSKEPTVDSSLFLSYKFEGIPKIIE